MLDIDPLTRVTVFVSQVGPNPQGGEFVTISEVNDAHRIDNSYDRATGILVAISQVNNIQRTRLQLQLTMLEFGIVHSTI